MSRLMSAIALLAVFAACGGTGEPSTRVGGHSRDVDHEEALDLLARWAAFVDSGDPEARAEFEGPSFAYTDIRSDQAPATVRLDPTRRLQVCGGAEMLAVEGGYDVCVPVAVLQHDDLLRSGTRLLTFRGRPGALRVTSDTFVVAEQEPVPDRGRPLLGTDPLCRAHRARPADCVVIVTPDETPRRLPYPRREISHARHDTSPATEGPSCGSPTGGSSDASSGMRTGRRSAALDTDKRSSRAPQAPAKAAPAPPRAAA